MKKLGKKESSEFENMERAICSTTIDCTSACAQFYPHSGMISVSIQGSVG